MAIGLGALLGVVAGSASHANGMGPARGGRSSTGPVKRTTTSESLERLAFMIGEWEQRGVMSPESFGDSGGEYLGPCSCEWGPFKAWGECNFESARLAGLGPYAVHVVIRHDPESDTYGSFVVNNYGQSTYTGRWVNDGTLVFVSEHGDALQRVRYRPLADGRVQFYADQSHDGGATWAAHTDAYWYREPTGDS